MYENYDSSTSSRVPIVNSTRVIGSRTKVADELENGVAPFKEENIRLNKENSKLRMGITRAIEEADDKTRDPLSRLRDLEEENNDLKLLVSQFAERVKKSDVETLEKTKRIEKLQEKMLTANIVVTERNKRVMSQPSKQSMEVDYFVPDACPQCIRLRNFVEYNKPSDRNPKVVDYMKLEDLYLENLRCLNNDSICRFQLADSRIEALQLQLRSLKNSEKEHLSLIASLKSRVDTREMEIEKLRELIKIRPGRDNLANALEFSNRNDKMDRNLAVGLKSAEMQLQILQRRNIELEDKLKKSILQEHEDFMLGKISTQFGIPNVPSGFLEKELDKYPSHDKMSLLEKLYYLERQLSHCCKEKAVLKSLLEECRLKHKTARLDEEDKDLIIKKSSISRSPKGFVLNKRTDASVRFSHLKPSLSKSTSKALVYPKQMTKQTVSAQRRFGEKSHVAKVSAKNKNPKKTHFMQDIDEPSDIESAVEYDDDDDEGEVSDENADSQFNSIEETETVGADEVEGGSRNLLEGKGGAQRQDRTLSHGLKNAQRKEQSGKKVNGKRESREFMVSSVEEQTVHRRKSSERETRDSSTSQTHSKGSHPAQRNMEEGKLHKQRRDIDQSQKSSATSVSNAKRHLEEMDAMGYQSDDYAYLDSEDEAEMYESDDQHSVDDENAAEDLDSVTEERQSSSKGERVLANKFAPKNSKTSKTQSNVSQNNLSSTSRPTGANRRQQAGAALHTADVMEKSRPGVISKTGARIGNVKQAMRHEGPNKHKISNSRSLAQGSSRLKTVPNNAIDKVGSIDDDDKLGRLDSANASSDELSDEFYLSGEEHESRNEQGVKSQYGSREPQGQKSTDRAISKDTGNSAYQRNKEFKKVDDEPIARQGGDIRFQSGSNLNKTGQKKTSKELNVETHREREQQKSQRGDQQNMKRGRGQSDQHNMGRSDPQTMKGKDPQMRQRGGPQAMGRNEPQTLKQDDDHDSQTIKRRDPQGMKHSGKQALNLRDPQGMKHSDKQALNLRDPQGMKHSDKPALNLRDPQGMKHSDKPALNLRDPQGMKPSDKQALNRRDPQGMINSDKQALNRRDPQGMKHSDKQALNQRDPQGMKQSDKQNLNLRDPQGMKHSDKQALNQRDPQGMKRGDPQTTKYDGANSQKGADASKSLRQGKNKDRHNQPLKQGIRGESIPISDDENSFEEYYAQRDKIASSAESDMEERISLQPSSSKSKFDDFENDETGIGAAGDSAETMARNKEMLLKESQKGANPRNNPTASVSDAVNRPYRKEGGGERTSDLKRIDSIDEVQVGGSKKSNSGPLTASQQQQRYVSGLQDSGPQYSRDKDNPKESGYLYTDDKRKHGISAVEEPSLLSLSGLEGNPRDFDEDESTNRRLPVGNPILGKSHSRDQDQYDNPNPRHPTSYDTDKRGGVPPRKHPEATYPERRGEFGHQNPFSDSSGKPVRMLGQTSQDRERASVSEQYFREPSRNFRKDQTGIADIEFSRAGDTDATASYGDISDVSYSRDQKRGESDLGNRAVVKRGEPSYMTAHSKSKYDDRNRFGVGYENPSLRNRVFEESRNMRSVGVNTEDHRTGMPTMERGDSQEKKTLFEKISVLQRKLDELHTESSRHQLKSFELQGELERTKHMLQVEKQERELATSELRRLREQQNESTARMLMNSAIGSDGSFRRGTTPMELEREIVNLRAALSSLDRDKDEMRVELDRKDEKLARVSNDASKYVDEISQLKLRLKNAELQINHTGESAKEQGRESEFLKKQLDANRRDLEKTIRERDDALKELHKISGAHAKGQMERRSVETELENKSKEADDLRKQVQRYIDEVRRIEELLLDKEEELEMLIQHYRALTAENSTLEVQRTSLEREASSIRDSVRDAVDQNISYKTQLASQNALVSSLEEEIQRLTQQIAQLENKASTNMEKEKMLESDMKASKDLLYRLEIQMDKLKLDFADCESRRKQLEAENIELTEHINSLENRLQEETDRQQQLENLVANSREKDFQLEKTTLDISRERDELTGKLTNLQQRSETLNTEVSRYRLKSIELQNELDRTRRQLESEKRERETALSELRRVRDQLSSSSANYLLNTALGSISGSQTGGLLTDSSVRQMTSTSVSGSTFRHNIASEIAQRGSREQSPLTTPYTPGSDLQLETPIAASTTRPEEQSSEQFRRDVNQTGEDFEAWDSPK
ncbi:hypothetical protein Ocin01_10673 [Orchesella cincta]|uniref:Centrosomal protein n=1 Tax=Orchesella cincta TaxID=48709 RepID=A0A1D2MTI0_ORCCI|nr:hypothetical protein Ocin01_10673 [Orchesella cincta]